MEILHEEAFGIPANQSSSQLEGAANWGAEGESVLSTHQPKPSRIPLRRRRIKEQKQRQVVRLLVKSPSPPSLRSVEPWVVGKGFSSTPCPRLPADFGADLRDGTINLSPEMPPKGSWLGTAGCSPFSLLPLQARPRFQQGEAGTSVPVCPG